jgi:hypothetical protein
MKPRCAIANTKRLTPNELAILGQTLTAWLVQNTHPARRFLILLTPDYSLLISQGISIQNACFAGNYLLRRDMRVTLYLNVDEFER